MENEQSRCNHMEGQPLVEYSAATGRYYWKKAPICGTVPVIEDGRRIPSIAEFLTVDPVTELEQYIYNAIKKHNKPP